MSIPTHTEATYDQPLSTQGITDGIDDDNAPGADAPAPAALPEPRGTRILKNSGWTAFGLACLVLFTVLKLPDDRIKAYVQGMISAQLAPRGIGFATEQGYISIGWGLSYVMKGVTLSFPGTQPPAKVDKLVFSPSILPAIFGYQGGSLALYQGDGRLTASFSTKGPQLSLSFDARQLNLGKTGVLALAGGDSGGLKGSGLVSGSGSLSGDLSLPSTLVGGADLSLSKVVLDPQQISMFNVPRIAISEGKIELTADKGKAVIKTLKLGKPGSSDDLTGSGSGDVILGRNWDSSTLNAKANFKLSDPLMKAFSILDLLLGPGKQGDGSYSISLTGSVTAPNALPLAPGGK